ncbi:MAG TPA: peptidoglycan-associated lipoprotein Pal [Burkholderiales bacterium]|jgi:peptidoglycan-associated lipoprotein|nr:peptidoglycan-associated lipoprotein Pal [Burkholderiales bacterium]
MQQNFQDFGINLSSCRGLVVRTALLAAVALTGVACSSTKPAPAAPMPASAPAATGARPMAVAPQGETQEQILQRIIAMLAANSIYFDYNTYTIKPEYQGVLQKDFNTLKSMPPVSLRLEGNADERGSSEYNLALGQKRAEAVRRALNILGMPDSSVEAISYGKEKPKADCHDESCWSQNRRVDLAVKK